MKLGFVGLGAMGGRMAANLIKKGYEVTVSDVNPEAVKAAVALGAAAAEKNSELARDKDIILTSLPNAAIVESVILGKDGLLEGAQAGALIVDLSSITPQSIQKVAERAAQKGVGVMDAPVSGGTAGAEKGTLTIMAGGSEAHFKQAMPVLSCIGTKIDHVGDVGAGDTVKLVNNLLLGVNMAAVSEAFALGVKAGIAPETLYRIISSSSGTSYALTAKYEKFFSKGNFAPGFMIDLQYKDLQLAVDTAKSLKMPLMVGNVVQQMYEIARAQGYGQEDISAVIKLYEQYGGIQVREE